MSLNLNGCQDYLLCENFMKLKLVYKILPFFIRGSQNYLQLKFYLNLLEIVKYFSICI